MAAFCIACGAALAAGARFCGKCGAAAAGQTIVTPAATEPAAERRQVAVLFADLCGYTELAGRLDPEDTHALLDRFFERVDRAVTQFGGFVDKHIGDAVMAVFGAPVAHGDDPVRAVRAALNMHAEMVELGRELGIPLAVHIGLHTGEVLASATGSETHREYTVTGETVNLAARLLEIAKAGETVVSDEMRHAVAALVDCVACGEVELKGIARPVKAWRVQALAAAADPARGPFVGRRRELRQFQATLEDCRESGRGETLYLRGEAGIGKTRLIEEFRRLAAASGFACHAALVFDFGVPKGRDAVAALVRGLLDIALGGAKPMRHDALARALGLSAVTAEHAPFLRDMLDLPQPREARAVFEAMQPATRRRGRQAALAALVAGLARRRPLLLSVEDIHWADAEVLGHLAALATAVAECPAILVLASRLDGDPLDAAWRGAVRGRLTTIDLAPLRDDEALVLASNILTVDDELARRCVARAGGNPLFLEQLARAVGETAGTDLPGSIQNLVLARIDRLATPDKLALQAASVVGQRFALDLLRHLLGDPAYDCASLASHFLVRAEGADFLFGHALIQEGVYSSLTKTRRRELHRRVAGWFAGRDFALKAEHLDRAEDPAAAEAYCEAAERLARDYRYEQALRLAERGLALGPEPPARHALEMLVGEYLRELGRTVDSIAAFERAVAISADDIGRCRAWIGVALGQRVLSGYAQAHAALEAAEVMARGHKFTRELGQVQHLRGNLLFAQGDLARCLAEHEQALAAALAIPDPELEARALSGLGDAYYLRGRMRTALGYFERCIALCDEKGFARIAVTNRYMLGWCRMFLNDFAGALPEMLTALADARQVGHRHAEMVSRQSAGHVASEMGDWAEAEAHLEQAIDLARAIGAKRFQAMSLCRQARVLIATARGPEGRVALDQALALCREVGLNFVGPWVLGLIAELAEEPAARDRALDEGEAVLRAGSPGHGHCIFYNHAMAAMLAAGDWPRFEHYASALADYTRDEPLPYADYHLAMFRALAAQAQGKRDDELKAELRRLRDEAARIGMKPVLPRLDAALQHFAH